MISQDNELKSKTFLPSSTVIANDKLTTQKILSDATYLNSVLSDKKHEKELKEIYSTVVQEKPWQEKLMDKALNNKDFLLINS